MIDNAESRLAQVLRDLLSAIHLELSFTIVSTEEAVPRMCADFSGPDIALLLERNGELLLAIEHLAARLIGLEPDQHDRLSLDAEGFKRRRENLLLAAAAEAAAHVSKTGNPFTFAPMSSYERRSLHLVLAQCGLETASTGEGSRRAVVLFPKRA